jgi:hypothetical protein
MLPDPPAEPQGRAPGNPGGDAQPAAGTEHRHASFRQVAAAVFWSFFGVRKRRHMQQDLAIRPLHVVIVGLLGGLLFVLALLALVRVILRTAG